MTAKRFEIREEDITVEYDLLYGLQTCIRKDGGELLTYMEIVDLLNELSKENEELKQENQSVPNICDNDEIIEQEEAVILLNELHEQNKKIRTIVIIGILLGVFSIIGQIVLILLRLKMI